MAGVGFEPTPLKWLVPKTSALDHSATLLVRSFSLNGLLLFKYLLSL